MKINPAFQNALPRLTDEEFKQLEENIVSAGEVYEPITLWGEYIVDGHNRWAIIQKHPEVQYRTRQMEFESEWAAIEWMCKHQLGRRNLTDANRTYTIGKLYEAKMYSHGGDRRSEDFSNRQTGDMKRVRFQLEDEMGIAPRTADRARAFAKAVDAGEEAVPGFREAVVTGQIEQPKTVITSLNKMDDGERKEAVEALMRGEPITPKETPKEAPEVNEVRTEEYRIGSSDYNEEDFIDQISNFPYELESSIRLFLVAHGDMLKNRKCKRAFTEMLNAVKDVVKKYQEVANEH